jgi:catechol 2,3-dioxygenase-like lactoylglutathione lyase family enzyme
MIIGFHHPGIVVPDLERARAFYSEALGFEYIREFGWDRSESEQGVAVMGIPDTAARCAIMKGPNCYLELFEYESPEQRGDPNQRRACDPGIAHIAFQVKNIDTVFDNFKAAGGIVHNSPVKVGEGYSIYCRDPFGNIIELMVIGDDEPDFDLIADDLLPDSVSLAD